MNASQRGWPGRGHERQIGREIVKSPSRGHFSTEKNFCLHLTSEYVKKKGNLDVVYFLPINSNFSRCCKEAIGENVASANMLYIFFHRTFIDVKNCNVFRSCKEAIGENVASANAEFVRRRPILMTDGR